MWCCMTATRLVRSSGVTTSAPSEPHLASAKGSAGELVLVVLTLSFGRPQHICVAATLVVDFCSTGCHPQNKGSCEHPAQGECQAVLITCRWLAFNPTDKFTVAWVRNRASGATEMLMKGAPQVPALLHTQALHVPWRSQKRSAGACP